MEMGDIYGLLRYLGLSAENTRFFMFRMRSI